MQAVAADAFELMGDQVAQLQEAGAALPDFGQVLVLHVPVGQVGYAGAYAAKR